MKKAKSEEHPMVSYAHTDSSNNTIDQLIKLLRYGKEPMGTEQNDSDDTHATKTSRRLSGTCQENIVGRSGEERGRGIFKGERKVI